MASTCNSQPYIGCPHVRCTINVIDQQIIVAFRLKKSNNAGAVVQFGDSLLECITLYNVKLVIAEMTSRKWTIYIFVVHFNLMYLPEAKEMFCLIIC